MSGDWSRTAIRKASHKERRVRWRNSLLLRRRAISVAENPVSKKLLAITSPSLVDYQGYYFLQSHAHYFFI